tara:strand:+ start:988 stop:1845 length:858 start_codon:yes stop_codon:yes gene_type:complete
MDHEIIIDTEMRVLHKEARHPNFALETSEPVREIIYEHRDFHLITNKFSGEAHVASMDLCGIDHGILSGLAWHDRGILDDNNEYVKECVQTFPDRFRALFIADPLNPELTAKDIHNLDESIFVGVELIPKWQKIHIDDPKLEPIFRAVLDRNMFFKPYTAHITQTLDGDSPYRLLQFLRKNPDLKVLIPHMGGLLCIYGLIPEIRKIMKNAYFITSVSSTMPMVKFASEVNEDNILFGTDFPFNHCHDQSSQLEYMFSPEISNRIRKKILGGSAQKLFSFSQPNS